MDKYAVILSALLLVGCGGGGGSNSTPPSDSLAPVFTSSSSISVNENQLEAIEEHGGEAKKTKENFMNLNTSEQEILLKFLRSI